MKQKLLIVCVAVLAVAAVVFGSLYFSNDADKTKAIENKESEIAVLSGEKDALTAEKDQLLADHTDAMAAKDGEIAALTDEKAALEETVNARDAEIAALSGEKAGLEETLKAKEEELARLTGEKDQLLADHAAAIEGKDGEITALTEEKAALEEEKAQLNTLKKDLIDEKAALEEAVNARDAEIAVLNDEKAGLEETLKGKEEEISKLTGEKDQLLADHAAVIEGKESEIDVLTGEKAELEEILKGKDAEIEKLNGEQVQLIAYHEKAIKEKDDEIQQLKDDSAKVLAEKDSLIADLKAEVEYLQSLVAAPVVEPVEDAEATVEEVAEDAVVTTYAEYAAASVDTFVVVETYVQAKQSWWDNKGTFYTQNEEGAYFIYEMAISEEDFNKLVPGTKILVKGYKGEWSGEIEIVDATFEILEGNWIAQAKDLTEVLGTDELINYQNQFAAFKGMTVEAISYKNGEPGDDIYVTLSLNGASYDFCVERYLTGPETEVYQAVGALHVGDVVDVEGFLYWYNGANAHITKVNVVACVE